MIDTVSVPEYADVPQEQGVPPMLLDPSGSSDDDAPAVSESDSLSDPVAMDTVKWGIFDADGNSFADFDSLYSVGFKNDVKISDYPVEQGGFQTYNIVNNPFDADVVLHCGGSEDRQAALRSAVVNAINALTLYTVMTPVASYASAKIVGQDVRNESNDGANMVKILLKLEEVRQTATVTFNSPADATALSPQAQGQVQSVDDPTIDTSGVS